MSWWAWWLLGIWVGFTAGAWVALRLSLAASRMPYRWACAAGRCRYEVASTDPTFVARLAEAHERKHR